MTQSDDLGRIGLNTREEWLRWRNQMRAILGSVAFGILFFYVTYELWKWALCQ